MVQVGMVLKTGGGGRGDPFRYAPTAYGHAIFRGLHHLMEEEGGLNPQRTTATAGVKAAAAEGAEKQGGDGGGSSSEDEKETGAAGGKNRHRAGGAAAAVGMSHRGTAGGLPASHGHELKQHGEAAVARGVGRKAATKAAAAIARQV